MILIEIAYLHFLLSSPRGDQLIPLSVLILVSILMLSSPRGDQLILVLHFESFSHHLVIVPAWGSIDSANLLQNTPANARLFIKHYSTTGDKREGLCDKRIKDLCRTSFLLCAAWCEYRLSARPPGSFYQWFALRMPTVSAGTPRKFPLPIPIKPGHGSSCRSHALVLPILFYKKQIRTLSQKKRFGFVLVGGDKRDRTADLLNAIQALSQLSYTPNFVLSQATSYSIPYHSTDCKP